MRAAIFVEAVWGLRTEDCRANQMLAKELHDGSENQGPVMA